ncbi:MAG: hypothetical protein ABSC01_05150 [Verrucomicrobiota bacterium]
MKTSFKAGWPACSALIAETVLSGVLIIVFQLTFRASVGKWLVRGSNKIILPCRLWCVHVRPFSTESRRRGQGKIVIGCGHRVLLLPKTRAGPGCRLDDFEVGGGVKRKVAGQKQAVCLHAHLPTCQPANLPPATGE